MHFDSERLNATGEASSDDGQQRVLWGWPVSGQANVSVLIETVVIMKTCQIAVM